MSMNLGRVVRMTVKSGAVRSKDAILETKVVKKVGGLMLTTYLKNRAIMKGAKLSFVAQVFAVIFDVACIPIEWCLIYPAQKLWSVLKVKWAGARMNRALPAK